MGTSPAFNVSRSRSTSADDGLGEANNHGRSVVRFSLDVGATRSAERRDALQYCIRNDLL